MRGRLDLLAAGHRITLLERHNGRRLFLGNLDRVQRRLTRLEGLRISFSRFGLIGVSEVTSPPRKPVGPGGTLVINMNLVLNLLLNVLLTNIQTVLLPRDLGLQGRSRRHSWRLGVHSLGLK